MDCRLNAIVLMLLLCTSVNKRMNKKSMLNFVSLCEKKFESTKKKFQKYLTLSGISVNLFLSNLKFINLLRCPKFNGNDTN